MQKKYGLQLATFLGAVPLLGKYTVEADIDLPRLARGRLYLDHKDPLVALDATALGHIPAEIDPMPELRHVGASGMCVPDFGLREQASGRTVAVELFHRWHRHALVRRLDELAVRPDPHFFVGVDLALTKDEAIAARVDGHPQVFTFNKFPSRKKLQPLLDRLDQAVPSASP
jgi:predicted nuclease of restriction endonuclease-like RecB superfamily